MRPCMDVMGVLAHGHVAALALSHPYVTKGSSFCTELILNVLKRCVDRGLDVRSIALHIQSDNTSKETKNNTLLRLAGVLTSLHRIKRADIQNLLSGHSHEDIDQWFSVITSILEAHPELHCPSDFVDCLNKYLRDPQSRPHEPEREAFMVESVREWQH